MFNRKITTWVKRLVILITILIGSMNLGMISAAGDNATEKNNYAVAPMLPADNEPNTSYFQFKVKPGEKRTLGIKIINRSSDTGMYEVTPRVASTNSNGNIDYSIDNQDTQLPAESQSLFSPDKAQIVTVPANSTKIAHVDFKAPAKPFRGIMLTGFTVNVHDTAADKKKATGIVAKAAYALAMEFYNQKPVNKAVPDVSFKGATYGLQHALPEITLGVENKTAGLVSKGNLTAKLTDKSGKTAASFNQQQLSFAPQSQFGLNLNLSNHQLPAGTYILAGNLRTKGGFTFPFKFPVKVTAQKVTSVQKNAANFGPRWRLSWVEDALLVVLVLILVELSYLIWKKYRQNRAERS